MYAVVQTGGKQYRVTPGEYVIVERLPGENGDSIELNEILLIDNDGKVIVGAPFVKDASVLCTIVGLAAPMFSFSFMMSSSPLIFVRPAVTAVLSQPTTFNRWAYAA